MTIHRNSQRIWDLVDAHAPEFYALSDRIWDTPELNFSEFRSAEAHREMLARQGFRVQAGVAGMRTALVGEAGDDGPVIAVLGEYDALPGLSQEVGVAEHRPIIPGGNGHGCGHNLLGAGALLAATAIKDWPAACAITAARPRRADRPRASWCAPGCSRTWTSPSRGIPRLLPA